MQPSQNPPPLRIYPPPFFNKYICETLLEYSPFFSHDIMRPSQNLPLPPRVYPLFSTTICDTPKIHPTPSFSTNLYMRPSQNLPLSSRNAPLLINMYDPLRIYPSLSEFRPLFNNYNNMRRSQNIPLPPRIPSPLPFNNYVRHSQNLPLPHRIYPLFNNFIMRPSHKSSGNKW